MKRAMTRWTGQENANAVFNDDIAKFMKHCDLETLSKFAKIGQDIKGEDKGKVSLSWGQCVVVAIAALLTLPFGIAGGFIAAD
jgi:hypothetical protein